MEYGCFGNGVCERGDAAFLHICCRMTGWSFRRARHHVDGGAAETFIAEKRIGERIKYLRLKKSMGLVELGRHTGLSASFLSQLETGRVVPTLRNLARIAMVFSKDLSYFFDPEPQTLFRVHRRKERVRLPQTGADDPRTSSRAWGTWCRTGSSTLTSRSFCR